MHRTRAALVTALLVAGMLGARWLRPAPEAATPDVVAPTVAPDPMPPPATPTHATTERAEPAGPDASRAALVRADPNLEDRARQHALAPEADARWQRAVDEGGYEAGDLDTAVRQLFRTLDLEPRYAEGGLIEGLVISSLPLDHPLERVGFRPGDRIERIQGTPLRDPAEIPSLLARLGPNVSFCVDRAGVELCREVHLE